MKEETKNEKINFIENLKTKSIFDLNSNLIQQKIQDSNRSNIKFKKLNQTKSNLNSNQIENSKFKIQQTHLSNLIEAIQTIILDSEKINSLNLSILNKFSNDLALSNSPYGDLLYNHLESVLKLKAKHVKSELIQTLPSSDSPNSQSDLLDQIKSLNDLSCQTWVSKLYSIWQSWSQQSTLAVNLLLPFDHYLLKLGPNYISISQLAFSIFRNDVIGQPSDPIWHYISVAICHQVTAHRSGKQISLDLLRSINQLIYTTFDLDHILNLVVSPLNQVTESFYRDQGIKFSNQIKAGSLKIEGSEGYLKIIQTSFESENSLHLFLFRTPYPSLNRRLLTTARKSIGNHMVLLRIPILIDYGFLKLLDRTEDQESRDSLSKLYKLITMYGDGTSQELRTSFSNYIKRVGSVDAREIGAKKSKIRQERVNNDAGKISNLFLFKIRLDRLVTDCFSKDPQMISQIQLAFESLMNPGGSQVAKALAWFFDQISLNHSRFISPEGLDYSFDCALTLFRLTPAKDTFSKYFELTLARRLLFTDSKSLPVEKSLIDKFTKECGTNFTYKWVVMVRDMELSEALTRDYLIKRQEGGQVKSQKKRKRKDTTLSLSSGIGDEIILKVHVLTFGIWPISIHSNSIIFPPELQTQLDKFENFYTSQSNFSNRKLTWVHQKSQFLLGVYSSSTNQHRLSSTIDNVTSSTSGDNQSGLKVLDVFAFVGLILLLFNDLGDEQIDLQSIIRKTGIKEKQVIEGLRSLVYGTPNFLIKHNASTDDTNTNHEEQVIEQVITSDDRFSYNSNWSMGNSNDQLGEPIRIKLKQVHDSAYILADDDEASHDMELNQNQNHQPFAQSIEKQTLIEATVAGIMKNEYCKGSEEATMKFEEIREKVLQKIGCRIGLDQLDTASIKLSIETLVEKEYLVRIGQDGFKYLA